MTEDKMVGWHYRLNGHEFEQTPGDSEGQEAWLVAVHEVAKSWTRLSAWRRHGTRLQYSCLESPMEGGAW